MASRRTSFSVRATQGGRLVTATSPENVGVGNYMEKTNWRRFDDKEILREGTLLFEPLTPSEAVQSLDTEDEVLGVWECKRPNDDRCIVAATATTIYRFNEATGNWDTIGEDFSSSTKYWQSEELDGYLILNNAIDLPVTYREEESSVVPMYEMRDIGIASVGTIGIYNGFLICADVVEIQEDELDGWISGGDPYGIVDPGITNRIKYQLSWADFGEPRNWAPAIVGVIESSDKDKITLSRPAPYSFPVGAKLAIAGAGPDGGVLGGQVGFDDGVTVTDVTGSVITINTTADASLVYPLTVTVTRFADTSTFVGKALIKDDSSGILRVRALKQVLVVYRETGIWQGRYTGDVETPFQFKPAYQGANVPIYPRAIADVNGDYHLYATHQDFYYYDGAGDPRLHDTMDDAATLFFEDLAPANQEDAFATHNPITSEIWFHCPNGVLAFDYRQKTASWIDEAYSASCYARKPGGTEYWFVLAREGRILQYGATAQGHITFNRLGEPVVHTIKHGEVHLNDDSNEKDLLGYMPLFSRVTDPVTITMYGRDNVARSADTLFTFIIEEPTLTPLVETFYRNIYFQDKIEYTSETDVLVEYVGSTFTFDLIRSGGATRNDHGSN